MIFSALHILIISLILIGFGVFIALVSKSQGYRAGVVDGEIAGNKAGYKKGYKRGVDEGFERGAHVARIENWTHVALTGEDLRVYLNGKELSLPPTSLDRPRSWGFWHKAGHTVDGFVSNEPLDADRIEALYAKDLNKLVKQDQGTYKNAAQRGG